jgi:hypothetical protein
MAKTQVKMHNQRYSINEKHVAQQLNKERAWLWRLPF